MSFSQNLRFRGRRLVHGQSAVYHVVNRIALSSMILNDEVKGQFVRMMRRQAAFAGVEVLAHCVMTNHFHLLVRVPEPKEIDDAELLQRYRALYSHNCPFSAPDPDVLEGLLKEGGDDADAGRKRLMARMHRLSPFVSELKQRFSIWFNKNRHNKGTVWSERFRSIIVEDSPEFTAPVAAYIDLNPVRAKLVEDPSEYSFSSYGAAMIGDRIARDGLEVLYNGKLGWRRALEAYRVLLYGKGSRSKGSVEGDQGLIDASRAKEIVDSGGKLSWAEYLRMRVGYFSRGGILGSSAFVSEVQGPPGVRSADNSSHCRPMKGIQNLMYSQRDLQKDVF